VTARPLDAARDALIALRGQLIAMLAAQNAALATRVAELEERLARLERATSRNALLTELPNVSAVQAECTPRQATTGMSERSESPGRRGPVVSPIATETGHTRLNRAPAFSSLPISGVDCSTS
jgi:hypothetical protein